MERHWLADVNTVVPHRDIGIATIGLMAHDGGSPDVECVLHALERVD